MHVHAQTNTYMQVISLKLFVLSSQHKIISVGLFFIIDLHPFNLCMFVAQPRILQPTSH